MLLPSIANLPFIAQASPNVRMITMLCILITALSSGYITSKHTDNEKLAKLVMSIVVGCFNWLIVLFVIWRINLSRELIFLPILNLIFMALLAVISFAIFRSIDLTHSSRLTLIIAGILSNMSYTGGAVVCYVFYGFQALAIAHLYFLLGPPAVSLLLLPFLKAHELKTANSDQAFKIAHLIDYRLLAIPAAIIAVILNLTNVKVPIFITKFNIVQTLVYTASFLAFFAIGLRLKFSALKNYTSLYFLLALIKFIIMPIIALSAIGLMAFAGIDLTPLTRNVIIILSCCPAAVTMVILSNVFSLDAKLASAIWVVNNLTFILIVVPLLFVLLT